MKYTKVGYKQLIRDHHGLSEVDHAIIRFTADGLTGKEIGFELSIGHNTVETYRQRIFKRVGVRNSPQLIAWAYDKGILIPVL